VQVQCLGEPLGAGERKTRGRRRAGGVSGRDELVISWLRELRRIEPV
jgi:hypothetical protein